jgi:hypothetical protein
MTLQARIARIEARTRPNGDVVVIWRDPSETDSDAKARWRRTHPGQDPAEASLRVIVVGWRSA